MTQKNYPWWNIFSDSGAEAEEICPAVPVNSGQSWQQGLASFYCPCKADPQSNECQLPLI